MKFSKLGRCCTWGRFMKECPLFDVTLYLPLRLDFTLHVRVVVLKGRDRKLQQYKTTKTIKIPIQIRTFGNSCMFSTPCRKPAQNSKFWKYPKVQNLQVRFLYDLEGKEARHARHHKTNKINFISASYYNWISQVIIFNRYWCIKKTRYREDDINNREGRKDIRRDR